MTWNPPPPSWWPWPDKRVTYRNLADLWSYVVQQTELTALALQEMRDRMSAVDDMVVRFGVATDEIAADLAALRDEVAGLDAGVAAKFEPLVSRLEGLGADVADPIPAPEPPVDEPA